MNEKAAWFCENTHEVNPLSTVTADEVKVLQAVDFYAAITSNHGAVTLRSTSRYDVVVGVGLTVVIQKQKGCTDRVRVWA